MDVPVSPRMWSRVREQRRLRVRKTGNIKSGVVSFEMAKDVIKELGDEASMDLQRVLSENMISLGTRLEPSLECENNQTEEE